MISTTIFILWFITYLIIWHIILRVRYFFTPENIYQFYNNFIKQKTKIFYRMANFYTGFKLNIESSRHLKLPPSFIILANHQSLGDIPAIIAALPDHNVRFVAKKELSFGIPLISFCLRIGKHALINRKGSFPETKKKLISLAKHSKKDNTCLLIFPEGTRSKTGKIMPFHSSAFRIICRETDLPVLSVAIDGGYKLATFFKITDIASCTYRVKLLSLYHHPENKKEEKKLLTTVFNEIKKQLQTWRLFD